MSPSSWNADLFTIMPDMFPGPLGHSLSGSALAQNLWQLDVHDIRDAGVGKHRAVDDTPVGGGPGMVLRSDVLAKSFDQHIASDDPRPRVLMSPRGEQLTQGLVRTLSSGSGVIVVCGRFEGVDERFIAARGLREISIGDYVLSGGEIAAMTMLDACVRLLPGVMGHNASGDDESFENGLLEYPHYTKPREWEGQAIPEVLLSGDHKKIADWRKQQALELTRQRRPDLLEKLRK